MEKIWMTKPNFFASAPAPTASYSTANFPTVFSDVKFYGRSCDRIFPGVNGFSLLRSSTGILKVRIDMTGQRNLKRTIFNKNTSRYLESFYLVSKPLSATIHNANEWFITHVLSHMCSEPRVGSRARGIHFTSGPQTLVFHSLCFRFAFLSCYVHGLQISMWIILKYSNRKMRILLTVRWSKRF